MPTPSCPVCNTGAEAHATKGGAGTRVRCSRCGSFKISGIALHEISHWSWPQRINLSGWIREHQGFEILASDVPNLASLRTPSVGEKAEKVFLRLGVAFPTPGQHLSIDPELMSELLGVASAADSEELRFLLQEFLLIEKEYLKEGGERISPKGWAHLDSLRQGVSNSTIGFIAMWFDESVIPAWKAMDDGIRASGYEPLRIDQKEHNNKIDDEIVAGIRRSRFLVADFTGQRGGVYFEAGFANGFGLPVIWLCRKDEMEKNHFDTRQYNFIVWEPDKLPELTKALQNRIEATIGRGPLTVSA